MPDGETSVLLIDGLHGVHIPELFARWHAHDFTYPDFPATYGTDIAYLLLGPEAAHQGECFDDIVDKAVCTKDGYQGWTLQLGEAGDVFLVAPEED